MFDRLRTIMRHNTPRDEPKRQRLLRLYPNHLDLIDSREIPHEYATGPDLSYLCESAKFYYDLIVVSSPHLKDKPRAGTDADREMASIANNRIIWAIWGLIARCDDSVQFAIDLFRSKDRDHREAAANIFCGLREAQRLPEILDRIHTMLASECVQLVLDSLLGALGQLRSRDSIPVLARYILDESVDLDTRDTAATSLGQIVRKRFDKTDTNTVEAAYEWLTTNGRAGP